MKFSVKCRDAHSSARTGVIETDHGTIHTPIFMPVGTVGSVKGIYHRDLKEDIGAEIILGNTYHLYLRPGLDILRAAGGLHKFESWDPGLPADSTNSSRGTVPYSRTAGDSRCSASQAYANLPRKAASSSPT